MCVCLVEGVGGGGDGRVTSERENDLRGLLEESSGGGEKGRSGGGGGWVVR